MLPKLFIPLSIRDHLYKGSDRIAYISDIRYDLEMDQICAVCGRRRGLHYSGRCFRNAEEGPADWRFSGTAFYKPKSGGPTVCDVDFHNSGGKKPKNPNVLFKLSRGLK